MTFTGKNLAFVRAGISLAIDALHTERGLHSGGPYCDDFLNEIEEDIAKYKQLLARIDCAIEKEAKK